MIKKLNYIVLLLFITSCNSFKAQQIGATKNIQITSIKDSLKCNSSSSKFIVRYNLPYILCEDKSKERSINKKILKQLDDNFFFYFFEDIGNYETIKDKLQLFQKKINLECNNELENYTDEIEIDYDITFKNDDILSIKSICSSANISGYNFYSSHLTLDLKKGKLINLSDIFNYESKDFKLFLTERIKKGIEEDINEYEELNNKESFIENIDVTKKLNDFLISSDDENNVFIDFIVEKKIGGG